jgi:hypothetical protein
MFKKKKGSKAAAKSKGKKPNLFASKKTPPAMPGDMSSVIPKQMPGAGGMPFGK